jgi:hypothetical protein
MDTTLKIALVGVLGGVIGGLITAVIGPHISWGIEKRRERQKYRREIIERCRTKIEDEYFTKQSFRTTQEYKYLKPYLSAQNLKSIEDDRTMMVPRDNDDSWAPYKNILIEALMKLQKDWKLV